MKTCDLRYSSETPRGFAAVGVMIATGWTIIRPFRKSTSILRIAVFSAGACALALAGVSAIQILLAAALLGCIFPGAQSS
jgi:hypothetical protein